MTYSLKDGEQYITLDGIRHWCRVAGAENSTTPLVVVHGGPGGNHYVFERTLGRQLEEFLTVVYYEQRGCGRSQAPQDDNDYSLDILVEDLHSLREALHIEKMNLLGYSFGGQLCLEYAFKYPGHVEKLLLQAPSIDDYEKLYKVQLQGFFEVATGAMKQHIHALMTAEMSWEEKYGEVWKIADAEIVDRLLFVDQRYAKFNRSLWQESRLTNTGKMAKVLLRTPPSIPLAERLGNIHMPALVMAGRYDRNTGLENSRDIARLLGKAQLVVLERSAHFPDIEETEQVAEHIHCFLTREHE